MPKLPVKITIKSAPADYVERFTVTCGYELQGVKRLACEGELDHKGGAIVGEVESDPLSQFPPSVHVVLKVQFVEATGLKSIEKLFDPPVKPGGVNFEFALQPPAHRKVTVRFDFNTLNATGQLLLGWSHLASGAAVRSGEESIKADRHTPPVVLDLLMAQEQTNALDLNLWSPTGTVPDSPSVELPVRPLTTQVLLDRDRTVLVRAARDTSTQPRPTIFFETQVM